MHKKLKQQWKYLHEIINQITIKSRIRLDALTCMKSAITIN